MNPPTHSWSLRGVRGSVPTPGRAAGAYGGNTTCLSLCLAPDRHLVIDCGSGLRSLARADGEKPVASGARFEILLTHYHLDHLIGLPLFRPLYDEKNQFTFYGVGWRDAGVQAILEQLLGPPWFPVPFRDTPSAKRFVDLGAEPLELEGLRISHARLHHPQGVTAFRLERNGRSLVFATDHEGGEAACDARLRALARNADVLIHDAQYTPEEYERIHRGWGHSSWRHAVECAREAGAARLLLFHHDPDRSDDQIDAIVRDAAREFPSVEAAREGSGLEV